MGLCASADEECAQRGGGSVDAECPEAWYSGMDRSPPLKSVYPEYHGVCRLRGVGLSIYMHEDYMEIFEEDHSESCCSIRYRDITAVGAFPAEPPHTERWVVRIQHGLYTQEFLCREGRVLSAHVVMARDCLCNGV